MKRINEQQLKAIIKKCINEKLEYNKQAKQYFPKYTGDPHRDAGKYSGNGEDESDYSRNKYHWSNTENERKFIDKQWDNGTIPDPFNPDSNGEHNARMYNVQHGESYLTDEAKNVMYGDFKSTLQDFLERTVKKYPMFGNETIELKLFLEDIFEQAKEDLFY